jgi:hypothetical protein
MQTMTDKEFSETLQAFAASSPENCALVRAEFDKRIARETDPDEIANAELLRDWITNPGFRKGLTEACYQAVTAKH